MITATKTKPSVSRTTRDPRVYSYGRISTKIEKQVKGRGKKRQDETAVKWCEKNGRTLEPVNCFFDKISAFKVKRNNAEHGVLKTILTLLDDGDIKRGDILLIECLDRLSRQNVNIAQELLLSIINRGHAGRRMLIWAGRMQNKDVANLELYERDMLRSLTSYVKLLRGEGVFGPLDVRVILDGMADAFISHVKTDRWPHARVRPVRDGTVKFQPVVLPGSIDGSNFEQVVAAMRPAMSVVWRDGGYPGDPCFDDSHKYTPDPA